MAKATHTTSVYELQSRQTGSTVFVTERALFRVQKIGRQIFRTALRPEITDKAGNSYERFNGTFMRCMQTGEVFNVIEQAPSIRNTSA
jgi:hypothetical protein